MKYKLIASDVDGTLNNDRFEITAENIAAIQTALKHGLKFVLCSGRSPYSLHHYEAQAGLNVQGQYGIGFNGSTVYDAHTKKIIFGDHIDKEVVVDLLSQVKRIDPTVKTAIYLQGNYMIAEAGLEKILEEYNTDKYIKIDFFSQLAPEHVTGNAINMYCIDHRPKLTALRSELKKPEGCTMAFTNENLLEFLPYAMNKAQGLTRLCQHLGIEMHETVSIGDNYNDIEMIQACGFGIAVANAVPELKNAADYVTKRTNNKDAIKEAVDLVLEMNRGAQK
ncbi:MAG: HAD family hydrolase [Defluviitaleaceae bacterium]|nr:HAD family hydrolase [Defluviitaleaceae bacterium]